MAPRRPFGVTLLAILAGLAAILAIWHVLQYLGLVPFNVNLGEFGVFSFYGNLQVIGAIMWGILAAIWIWVVRMLWSVSPQGWLFVTVLSILNLVMAGFSILGQTTLQAMLPTIIVAGIALFYCLLPGTKAAFGMSDR